RSRSCLARSAETFPFAGRTTRRTPAWRANRSFRGEETPRSPASSQGGMAKAPLVIGETLGQIGIILPRLLQDSVAGDDPTLHLLQPELPTELGDLAGLLALD